MKKVCWFAALLTCAVSDHLAAGNKQSFVCVGSDGRKSVQDYPCETDTRELRRIDMPASSTTPRHVAPVAPTGAGDPILCGYLRREHERYRKLWWGAYMPKSGAAYRDQMQKIEGMIQKDCGGL